MAVALLIGAALAGAAPGFVTAATPPGGGSASLLTLADAWALAEEHHPRVEEARQTLASLERDLRQREIAYVPAVSVSVSGLRAQRDSDGAWTGPSPGARFNADTKFASGLSLRASLTTPSLSSRGGDDWKGEFALEYPLVRSSELDGDALALRQARLSLAAAQRELEQLQDEIRAEVLAAMHAEQVAAARLDLAREAYAEAVAEWDIVQRQMELGIITEADFLAAQVNLLRAEQDRLSAQRTWEARRRELGGLLGIDDISGYKFEDVTGWTALPAPGDAEEAADRAVARSLTVWEREQAVETATMQLAAERERAGLTPQLTVNYAPRDPSSANRPNELTVALSVSYPLYDGGQRRMALEAREEAVIRAREALARAEEEVRQRVADLLVQLEDARRDVDIAALEMARAELELTAVLRQAQLPVAAAGEADVERARRARVRAELSWLEAVQRYQARWIELQRLQGPVAWELITATAPDGEGAH